jgi:hypothetical protein
MRELPEEVRERIVANCDEEEEVWRDKTIDFFRAFHPKLLLCDKATQTD